MKEDCFKELFRTINYEFKNKNIIKKALIHPSTNNKKSAYERMEFLGDSILDFVIGELVYNKYQKFNEGNLSKIHGFLVSRKICAKIGTTINIIEYIKFSEGAEKNNEKNEKTNIANAVEVLIAAIYLDGGIDVVKSFIIKYWANFLTYDPDLIDDPKTILQQIVQERFKTLPIYKIVSISGPDHSPKFVVSVEIISYKSFGTGKNKKEAEKNAAQQMIECFFSKKS